MILQSFPQRIALTLCIFGLLQRSISKNRTALQGHQWSTWVKWPKYGLSQAAKMALGHLVTWWTFMNFQAAKIARWSTWPSRKGTVPTSQSWWIHWCKLVSNWLQTTWKHLVLLIAPFRPFTILFSKSKEFCTERALHRTTVLLYASLLGFWESIKFWMWRCSHYFKTFPWDCKYPSLKANNKPCTSVCHCNPMSPCVLCRYSIVYTCLYMSILFKSYDPVMFHPLINKPFRRAAPPSSVLSIRNQPSQWSPGLFQADQPGWTGRKLLALAPPLAPMNATWKRELLLFRRQALPSSVSFLCVFINMGPYDIHIILMHVFASLFQKVSAAVSQESNIDKNWILSSMYVL